jgi:hypothetical protein
MAQAPATASQRRATSGGPVRLDRLSECVRRLDPATRALHDLSVRRGVRDDLMAPILRADPFHLAFRRARALERVASEVGDASGPAPLGEVRMALEALPKEAWGLPGMGPPALPAPGQTGRRFAREPQAPEAEADQPWVRMLAGAGSPAVTAQAATVASATAETSETDALPATGMDLVPTTPAELDTPARPGRRARLDDFASESPTLRLALRQLGRAMAAKAVRVVVWRRR